MRWFKTAGGLLAIMLLMASCIRVDGAIKIEDDGSGTVNFLSALNTESLTSVLGDFDIPEEELGDTAELCDGFSSDFNDTDGLPAGAVITPYDQDGFCGSRVEYSLSPSLDQSTNIQEVLDPTARLYKKATTGSSRPTLTPTTSPPRHQTPPLPWSLPSSPTPASG